MDKFTIETSLQFPVFKLTELISYSEVKKPSGVSYIILVLIKDSPQRNSLLRDTLINFGVPERLHEIFIEAINDLLRQGLIESEVGDYLSPVDFKNCRISSFSFTEKGEKIFADGYITATDAHGNPIEKETKLEFFYDIAANSFSLRLPADMDARPLSDASIGPEFFKRFAISKSEEDFVNSSKGQAIGIKKEEIVTKVETQIRDNWVVKYDCSIEIDGDKARIVFEDKTIQRFFEANYTPEIVTKCILLKNKFRFPHAGASSLRLSDFQNNGIKSVILPKDLADIAKQKARLSVTKGNYTCDGFTLKTSETLPYDAEFIHVNPQGQASAYVSGNFFFEVDGLGSIQIPLGLELSVEQKVLQKALLPIVSGLSAFSSENYEKLVRISECSKDFETAFKVMEGYLSQADNPRKISILSEMRPYSSQSPSISAKAHEMTAQAYNTFINSLEEDGLESAIKIASWIPKYIGISPKESLDRIFGAIRTIKDPLKVFQLLAEARYDEDLLCSYVNPVPECLRSKNATLPSLVSLIAFDNSLQTLKRISGINNPLDFAMDEETIDKQAFHSAFSTAFSERKHLRQFESVNKELFLKYDGLMRIFERVNDSINMLDNALKNPNNIKAEIIERKIVSGEYQYALVNLSGKLETMLRTKFGLDGALSVMLSEARNQKLLDEGLVSDLHRFRIARNAQVHFNTLEEEFTADDLRRWSKEIFELEEGKE